MKPQTIVTNIRLPKQEWLQVKTTAAELGMSINEYVNFIIRDYSQARELVGIAFEQKTHSIWDLPSLAGGNTQDAFPLSADDEEIYG